MDVLPAAKITEIASGGRCKESYHAYLPRISRKSGSGGQSGVSFPAYQAWFSEILLPGDAMNALPAAKMAEIASGGQCKESYHAYLPRVGR